MESNSTTNWIVEKQICDDKLVVSVSHINDSTRKFAFSGAIVRGVHYPHWQSANRWAELDNIVTYRPSDVLVVSYPKCGTTWAEQCVLLLLHQGNKELMNPANKNVYSPGSVGKVWLEACIDQDPCVELKVGKEAASLSLAEFNDAPEPRVIKSHAPIQNLLGCHSGVSSLPIGTKLVVVTRNPLDACVSSYYHAFNPYKSGWPFEAWASAWLSGNTPHGSWFSWVRDWKREAQVHAQAIHWVQYEDLIKNPFQETAALAVFLGVDPQEDLIRSVVEAASFDSMKSQALEKGGETNNHLRKGISGDWKAHFNPTLFDEFVKAFEHEMAGTNIEYSLGDGSPLLTMYRPTNEI